MWVASPVYRLFISLRLTKHLHANRIPCLWMNSHPTHVPAGLLLWNQSLASPHSPGEVVGAFGGIWMAISPGMKIAWAHRVHATFLMALALANLKIENPSTSNKRTGFFLFAFPLLLVLNLDERIKWCCTVQNNSSVLGVWDTGWETDPKATCLFGT